MKRFFLIFLMLLLPIQSFSASLPAYSPRYGTGVADVIKLKASQMGFAANDPRYQATTTAIGAAATVAAGAVTVGMGLPLWGTIAVTALSQGLISLGINGITKWLFNGDGTVTTGSTSSSSMPVWSDNINPVHFYGYPNDVALAIVNQNWPASSYPNWNWGSPSSSCPTIDPNSSVTQTCVVSFNNRTINGSPDPASINVYSLNQGIGGASNASGAQYVSVPASTLAISDAVAGLQQSEMSLALSNQILANSVNKLWAQVSAQPGYEGLPFSTTNPVTEADVAAYQAANPVAYPTVADFLAPVINPATGVAEVNPSPDPSVSTSPGIQTGASGVLATNLGVDPVIPAPTLETTPTAASILSPILNLMPDLKSFVVPSHSSVCPTPSLSLFGNTYIMDGQCTLLETARPTLYAVMAFVWVVIGLFIVLAA